MLVVILALVAVGSLVAYQLFGSNPTPSDTYGNVFSGKTNSTIKVETAVAPVSINIMGYVVIMAAVFVIVGAGVLVAKAVGVGGGSHGMR